MSKNKIPSYVYDRLSDDEILNIKKFRNKNNEIMWDKISSCEELSESFLERHFDKLNIDTLSCRTNLSEYFIEKYFDKLNLNFVFSHTKSSEEFIEKYLDIVDISVFLEISDVSEEFIKKHIYKIKSTNVFSYPNILNNLSYKFVEENFDLLDKDAFSLHRNFSYDFYILHRLELNKENIEQNKTLDSDVQSKIEKNEIQIFRQAVKDNFDDIKLWWSKWFTKTVISEGINDNLSLFNSMSEFFYHIDLDIFNKTNGCDHSNCEFDEQYGFKYCDFECFGEKYFTGLFGDFIEDITPLYSIYSDYCCNEPSDAPNYIVSDSCDLFSYLHDYKFETNLSEIFNPLQYFKDNYKNVDIKKFINNKNVTDDVKKEIQAFLCIL